MRRVSKFKFLNKKHNYPYFSPNRVLRFQRPKWKFIKKKILRLKKNRKLITKKIVIKKKLKLFKNILFLKSKVKQKFLYSNFFLLFFKKIKKVLKIKNIVFLKLKFKKLAKLQKSSYKNQVKFVLNNFFFNFMRVTTKISSWNRLRFNFKETLWMKFSVLKYFNFCFSTAFFKRLYLKKKSRIYNLSLTFVKPEYRLDLVLWRLKFFVSPYVARAAIRTSLVKVLAKINDSHTVSSYSQYFVKGGDLIKINIKNFNFKKNLLHFARSIYLPSFLEVDYYTNTILILKNFKVLTDSDLNSILKEPLCFYKFKNFIFK